MNNQPTEEELFYAAIAGELVGILARAAQAIVFYSDKFFCDEIKSVEFRTRLSDIAKYCEEKAEQVSKRAEEKSKELFLKRYELSGESQAAHKRPAN